MFAEIEGDEADGRRGRGGGDEGTGPERLMVYTLLYPSTEVSGKCSRPARSFPGEFRNGRSQNSRAVLISTDKYVNWNSVSGFMLL